MIEDLKSYIDQIKEEQDIIAKANLLHFLVHEKNARIVDLAKTFNKTSSYICHLLRLAELPEMIIDGYYSKLVTLSHLFVISRIKDKKKLIDLYEQILKKNCTVQETEEMVRDILYAIGSEGMHLSKEEIKKEVEKIKKKHPGLDAKVIQTRIKGKIILETKGSLDKTSPELKLILERIGN